MPLPLPNSTDMFEALEKTDATAAEQQTSRLD